MRTVKMSMVRSQMIRLTPEEQAVALGKLKDAYAEYGRQKAAKTAEAKR